MRDWGSTVLRPFNLAWSPLLSRKRGVKMVCLGVLFSPTFPNPKVHCPLSTAVLQAVVCRLPLSVAHAGESGLHPPQNPVPNHPPRGPPNTLCYGCFLCLRRRSVKSSGPSTPAASRGPRRTGGSDATGLRWYTDESSGLKLYVVAALFSLSPCEIRPFCLVVTLLLWEFLSLCRPPTVVLIMSLVFIAVVILLHLISRK